SKAVNGGLTLARFDPGKIQGGGSAFWAAMILGILAYTGYDVISTVGEEAKAPRRLLPKATLFACVGVGIFWAINSWAFSIAEPVSKVQSLIASGVTPATPIAGQFWGWGGLFADSPRHDRRHGRLYRHRRRRLPRSLCTGSQRNYAELAWAPQ